MSLEIESEQFHTLLNALDFRKECSICILNMHVRKQILGNRREHGYWETTTSRKKNAFKVDQYRLMKLRELD